VNISTHIQDLKRRRKFVRAIVFIGILVSVSANVLGSTTFWQAGIAGWPPICLLATLEVLTRIPSSRKLGTFGRVTATIAVATAAGWLSYWHMASTVSHYGEQGGSQYVWPFSVDGLMTVAAIGLVELGARIRELEAQHIPQAPAAVVPQSPGMAPVMAPSVARVVDVVRPSEEARAIAFRNAMPGRARRTRVPVPIPVAA